MNEFPKKRVVFGCFEADLQTQELWKYGRKLKLGGQPFGILAMLLERPGELVSRDALRDRLWSADTFVDFNQGLNAAVNKLRDCLSDSADEPRYIETLPRRGYRFIGEVSGHSAPPIRSPTSSTSPARAKPLGNEIEASGPATSAGEPATPWSRLLEENAWKHAVPVAPLAMPYRRIAIALLLALVAAVASWILVPRRNSKSSGSGGPVFLGGSPRPASDPAFSPDGNRIAFRRIESEGGAPGIFVSNVGGEKELELTRSEADCCPTWSPDGKMVAFTRRDGDALNIFLISSEGGNARKVYSIPQKYGHGEISWSPDGASLAFSADGANGGSQIFALSLDGKTVHALTEPENADIDWGPSFSPDGSQLSFIRSKTAGFPEDLYATSAHVIAAKAEQQLTSGKARILGPPAWTSDSQSIVYSSSKDGEARLWRIPAKGGIPEAMPSAGVPSWHPSIPSHGTGLAFQHILGATSIWRLELAELGQKDQRMVVISTEGRNEAPQLAPNGKKLAFMSDRAGSMEIWISDPDGSYPIRLTDLGGCGSPRWSPDSRRIAFDSIRGGVPAVYLVDVNGSPPVELVRDHSQNMVPSWSRDGKWIYFASDRSGDDEVWKVPAAGGIPLQATRDGGFAALESPDGKTLYYAKSRYERPEIWQVPAQGGQETLVTPLVRPGGWANWAITETGIYFVDDVAVRNPHLEFYDLGTRKVESLSALQTGSFWLSISQDGQSLWYGQAAHNESSIMVQPNFR